MMSERPSNPGPAFYTDITLKNNLSDNLAIADQIDWCGTGTPPEVIQAELQGKIKHDSDPFTGDSEGAIVYAVQDDIKWIVAWRNMKDEDNKVYVNIIKGDAGIDWTAVRSLLSTSTSKPGTVYKYGHVATAEIDPTSSTAPLNAMIKRYED